MKRRDFLKKSLNIGFAGSGIANSIPFYALIESLIRSRRFNVYAENSNISSWKNKYFHFLLTGGAARWYWDLPLTPNGSTDAFSSNPMVGNVFEKINGSLKISPKTFKFENYNLPHIWSSKIATPSGPVNMTNLCNHMLSIRGISMRGDGHLENLKRMLRPQNGETISGLAANFSDLPLGAICYPSSPVYNSKSGKPEINLPEKNLPETPIDNLVSIFKNNNPFKESSDLAKFLKMDEKIEQILGVLQKKDQLPNWMANSQKQRILAKETLKQDLTQILPFFLAAQEKYTTLLTQTFTNSLYHISQVDDQPISITNDAKFRIAIGNEDSIIKPSDLNDFRNIFDQNTSILCMANSFALAETLTEFNLSNILTFSLRGFSDLLKKVTTSNSENNRFVLPLDLHYTGSIPTLLLMSKYFQCLSACLYELTQYLKNKNIFDQSVIQISSEFGRLPRLNEGGSDHATEANTVSIFSGKINQYTLMGDIFVNSNNTDAPGTFGEAAPMNELSGNKINYSFVSSTVSELLDLPNLSTNTQSLLNLSKNRPKNVV